MAICSDRKKFAEESHIKKINGLPRGAVEIIETSQPFVFVSCYRQHRGIVPDVIAHTDVERGGG